jgi:hypothetical protein
MSKKARIIAFYLPQFHPIPENDEWWGKGFTEWTNVGKAKPLFRGHYQPRVPADLGYYDLRMPEVREAQAQMAKEAGIEGFCYWHYWFGGGKRLLEMPFNEVLKSGKPDFPFCLGWANESWRAKIWNSDTKGKDKVLIEQKYLGEKDNEQHFYEMLPAFKDKRYIQVDDKPFFLIYKPFQFKEVSGFMNQWNTLIKSNNVAERFYFVANADHDNDYDALKQMGFDAVTVSPVYRMQRHLFCMSGIEPFLYRIFHVGIRDLFNIPIAMKHSSVLKYLFDDNIDIKEDVIPSILPNWDHSPRSAKYGIVLQNSTPKLFKQHVKTVIMGIENKSNKLVLLKSWNEWAEGNYMEPDIRYGNSYLDILKSAL